MKLEGNEFYGENGYFQLVVSQQKYSIYLDKELDSLSVSTYWWMRYLIEATLKLKENSAIYISDIETPMVVWIELRKQGIGIMSISKIEAQKADVFSAIEVESKIDNKIVDWLEVINFKNYKIELKKFLKTI